MRKIYGDMARSAREMVGIQSTRRRFKRYINQMQVNKKVAEDAFYKHLEFTTGGIRGELGPGTNRLNIYTIRKAAEGLAKYILSQGELAITRGVVVAYDSRHKSAEFALEVAKK